MNLSVSPHAICKNGRDAVSPCLLWESIQGKYIQKHRQPMNFGKRHKTTLSTPVTETWFPEWKNHSWVLELRFHSYLAVQQTDSGCKLHWDFLETQNSGNVPQILEIPCREKLRAAPSLLLEWDQYGEENLQNYTELGVQERWIMALICAMGYCCRHGFWVE